MKYKRVFLKGEKIEQLIEAIHEAWHNEIKMDFIEKLYSSMPKRIAECIKMKGRNTKY